MTAALDSHDIQRDRPPLAVDLDGTLVRSDTLHEGCIRCLRAEPAELVEIGQALRKGKAAFKRAVAGQAGFDPALLPYNRALLAFLAEAKQRGRRLGLFTAADQSIAERVAAHVGLFDVARGSDGETNLSAHAKVDAIRESFGARFAYAGDAAVDHPIFEAAESVILVGHVERLRASLPDGKEIEAAYPMRRAGPMTWVKALRLQHWVKNALVLVAPILGLQSASLGTMAQAMLLFVAFGLLASATYLVNDLLDLAADRQHPSKRSRPLAAGTITVRDAITAAAILMIAAAVVAAFLPIGTKASLLAYLVLTLIYSLSLKQRPMLDVLALAALFTIRIVAGGTLLPTRLSPWLVTFSMLFFLGLAMIKRYAELERVTRANTRAGRARGYSGRDLPILLAAGVASHISAVVIFTIYLINEHYPRNFYANPSVLWGTTPILLLWTLRAWHLSVHGRMNEDPVVFALKDRFSLLMGAAAMLILLLAWM